MTATEWHETWPYAHEEARVPGDHFSMLGQHAGRTAQEVRAWLA